MQTKNSFYFLLVSTFILASASLAIAYDLPTDRVITWQGNVGVDGGIPARTTEIDCTAAPYNVPSDGSDAKQEIQACLNGISSGETAYLPAGTYTVKSAISMRSNKTLRGAGADVTILQYPNNTDGAITFNGGYTDTTVSSLTVNSGYTKGSTTLVMANASTLSVGEIIYISELNDASLYVTMAAQGQGGEGCNYCGPFGSNGNRARSQVIKITAINSNTLTIEPPLYFTFSAGRTPQVHKNNGTHIQNAGVEALTLQNMGSGGSGGRRNVRMQGAANSWIKDTKIINCGIRCIHLDYDNYRIEISGNYLTECIDRNNTDSCYGVEINASSANLVENNIFSHLTGSNMILVASSGNVFGYNYARAARIDSFNDWFLADSWGHGGHSSFNLFESNYGQGVNLDYIHGSNSHNTLFRNRYVGKDETDAGRIENVYAITTETLNYNMSYIGNVLGLTGWSNTYEIKTGNQPTSPKKAIYATGTGGNNSGDNMSYSTMLRHMNYDYVTNSVTYCNQSGEPGCQGGSTDRATLPASLYLASKPAFFGSKIWPVIGSDLSPMVTNIPAKERYEGDGSSRTPKKPTNPQGQANP